jgi:hypothetical protein
MNNQEKMLFCKLLSRIAEFFNKTLSPNDLEIYWSLLQKYELDSINHALNLHMVNPKNGQFMPKPADIIRYIEKDNDLKALYAWDKVTSAVTIVGSYESIKFDDPLIHIIINQMGGWITRCHVNEKQLPFVGNEFQRRYGAYLIYPSPPAPPHLPGFYECQNRLLGYLENIPAPVFFGDKEVRLLISNFNLTQLENDDASK